MRDHWIHQGFPDRTLVELRVTEEGDLAPTLRHLEVAGHIAVCERAPQRGRRADPDRARREIDGVWILERDG